MIRANDYADSFVSNTADLGTEAHLSHFIVEGGQPDSLLPEWFDAHGSRVDVDDTSKYR